MSTCFFCKSTNVEHNVIIQNIEDPSQIMTYTVCPACYDQHLCKQPIAPPTEMNKHFIGKTLAQFLQDPRYLNDIENTFIYCDPEHNEISNYKAWLQQVILRIDETDANKIYVVLYDNLCTD